MAKEKAVSVVEEIRKAMREGGTGKGMPEELFFVPVDGIKVARLLSEFDEPVKVTMHDAWGVMMPQPCLEYYGKKCPFHGASFRTQTQYAWTLYDYEGDAKRVLLVGATQNSPMDDLLEIWDANGTLLDRDIKISRHKVAGKGSRYRVRDLVKKEFDGRLKNPYSEEKVFEIVKGLIRYEEIPTNGDEEKPRRKSDSEEEPRRTREREVKEDEERPSRRRDTDEEERPSPRRDERPARRRDEEEDERPAPRGASKRDELFGEEE